MSVEVPLDIFSYEEKQKLLKNLTVISQEKEGKKNSKYNKNVTLHCFEIIENKILLPFSYCHNFLYKKLTSHGFNLKYPNSHKTYPKCNDYKFPFPLRTLQKEILPEVLEILNRTHSIIISGNCGFGKTIFSLYIAYKIKLKVGISVKGTKLIEQWIDAIKKFCPGAKYQIIKGKTIIDKNVDFYIFNMVNIKKRKLDDFSHVGLLISDEIHTMCTPTNMLTMFYFQPKFLIGLSATPYRTDKLSNIIHLYFGIEIVLRELYRPFNAYCCYTDFVPKIKENSQGNLDWNSVIDSVSSQDDIMNLVVEITRFFCARNALILTKRVEKEGTIFFDKLNEYEEKVDIFTGSKDFYNENCRILVSTNQKAGTGFDFPKMDLLIIASDMEENFIQYLGRVFRNEDSFPIIIDIVHPKFRPLYNHFITRKDIYTKSGGEIKNLFTSFPELLKWLDYYKPIKI
jgi:superfamily II DNA or RNA helicase